MEDFEEKEMMKFSWPGLFIVTSLCSFAFGLFLKFIDGSHTSLFVKIGLLTLILAFFSFMSELSKRKSKKKSEPVSTIFEQD